MWDFPFQFVSADLCSDYDRYAERAEEHLLQTKALE